MKKKYAAMVLGLPTLAMLVLLYFTLAPGAPAESLKRYLDDILFGLVCFTIVRIPAYVWLFLSVSGFGVGAWLVRASRSRGWIVLGAFLSMLPVLTIILGFFFIGYRGP